MFWNPLESPGIPLESPWNPLESPGIPGRIPLNPLGIPWNPRENPPFFPSEKCSAKEPLPRSPAVLGSLLPLEGQRGSRRAEREGSAGPETGGRVVRISNVCT